MDQTFQVFAEAGKSAELGQVGDSAFDQLSFADILNLLEPGIGLQLAHGETDTLAFLIDCDDLDFDLLTNLEHFPGMINALPGEFREVHQAISAVNVDKSTEISQAGHPSSADIAYAQLIQQTLLERLTGLLQGGAFGEDQPAAFPVNLDDAHNKVFTDQRSPTLFGRTATRIKTAQHANLRTRNKTTQLTHRHQQPALIKADHLAFIGLTRLKQLFSTLPILLFQRTGIGQQNTAALVFRVNDINLDFSADGKFLAYVIRDVFQFP